MEYKFINGGQSEVTYYNGLRSTISALDALRLSSATSGLTICISLMAVAISAVYYTWTKSYFEFGLLLTTCLFLLIFIISIQYLVKIKMFTKFLRETVTVAKIIETQLITDERLRITHKFDNVMFDEHINDHLLNKTFKLLTFSFNDEKRRGYPLFEMAITLVMGLAILGFVATLLAAVLHINPPELLAQATIPCANSQTK